VITPRPARDERYSFGDGGQEPAALRDSKVTVLVVAQPPQLGDEGAEEPRPSAADVSAVEPTRMTSASRALRAI